MKGGLPIVNMQNMYNLGAALVKQHGLPERRATS